MNNTNNICGICADTYTLFGNNTAPLSPKHYGEKCCDTCNSTVVIPYRLFLAFNPLPTERFAYKDELIANRLSNKLNDYLEKEEYEKAAVLRDKIPSLIK